MATGAAIGAFATVLRDTRDGNSWTYLLDAAGWLLSVSGAIAEARTAAIFAAFQPQTAQRRAVLLFCLGFVAALGMCVLLSTLDGEGIAVVIRAVAAALLLGGIWAGLGGGLSLAATVGARYAADRLANLDDA